MENSSAPSHPPHWDAAFGAIAGALGREGSGKGSLLGLLSPSVPSSPSPGLPLRPLDLRQTPLR